MKWETVKLTDVCDFQGGTQPPKSSWSTDHKPGYVRMLQIRDFTQGKDSFIEYVKDIKTLKKCNAEDILIGRYGASIGKILTGLSGAYNVALVKTVPTKRISRRYLYFYLLSDTFQNFIQNAGSRAAQAGFNKEELGTLYITLPPLHIQEQIADTLDKADALRRKDQELLQKYDQLAQAIFYDMFGDPVRNDRGWECRELSDLAEIIMGQSPPGETYNTEGLGDPLLNGPTEFGEHHPVEKQWTTYPTKYCKSNDILFCVRGATAGKLNVADKVYCIGRGLAAIRPKADTLSSYLYLYLNNMYDVFQKTSDGSTFINISGDRLKSLSIPLLPESELAKFQKMSERLQEGIRVAKKSTYRSKLLFNGIMLNCFS